MRELNTLHFCDPRRNLRAASKKFESTISLESHLRYNRNWPRRTIANNRNSLPAQIDVLIPLGRVHYDAFVFIESWEIGVFWDMKGTRCWNENARCPGSLSPGDRVFGHDVVLLCCGVPFSRDKLRVELDLLIEPSLFRDILKVLKDIGLISASTVPVWIEVGGEMVIMNADVRCGSLSYPFFIRTTQNSRRVRREAHGIDILLDKK